MKDEITCLAGGGEAGALMRSIDWSQTAVGEVASWPQSLRTAVSLLLESRFPMYLAWGSEYTQFYNEGYRPVLGSTKHPTAMGQRASETFAESWHIIGPMFDGVMAGTAVGAEDWMLPLDRNGYLEECYFTFSYSPIRAENGLVGGVHVTVMETTARVLQERRLLTLRDAATNAAEAKVEREAWATALDALRANDADIPFALLYALSGDAKSARLVASTLDAADPGLAPAEVFLEQSSESWPLAQMLESRTPFVTQCLVARVFKKWPEPVETALAVPIARAGTATPYGFLLVGISPRRALDDAYRDFLVLASSHVATAIGSARAADEERRRLAAMAELDSAKTEFFSNVSHELRTPLALLLGPAEDALAMGAELSSDQREAWSLVHRSGLRLSKLVNALLDFSRIEADRMVITCEPTELGGFTAEIASSFRSAVEKAGLQFIIDTPATRFPAYIDRDMWEKIVLNLVSNAFKHTFAGHIRIDLHAEGDQIRLTVEDTGIGIAAQDLPHLFERFHRVRGAKSRSHEGTGIGLALVHELVRLHGGTVAVNSELGRGTIVTVMIGFGAAQVGDERIASPHNIVRGQGTRAFVEEADRWMSPPSVASAPHAPTLGGTPATRSARLLIADDNADMCQYLTRILSRHWQVEVATNGLMALEIARRCPPDLILSDVMMPHLDGVQLLAELRADKRTAAVPVILLSARAGEDDSIAGIAAGADDYLVKPFSARELIARTAARLEIARTRSAAMAERNNLLMQAPVPIAVVVGPQHEYVLANPLYCEMVMRRDLVGKKYLEVFPELSGTAIIEVLDRAYQQGEPFVANEYPLMLDKTGSGSLEEVIFRFSLEPLRDLQGQIYGLIALAVEITEQVLARRVLEQAQVERERLLTVERDARAAVAQSAHQFRMLVESIPQLAWTTDTRGFVDFFNQGWYLYSGTTPSEMETRGWESLLHPEDAPAVQRRWKTSLETGQLFEMEFRLRGADGFFRWFLTRAVPARDQDGTITRWFGTNTNIDEFRQTRRELEHASRAKDEFLAVLGHELRNPLSPILTALRLMKVKDATGNTVKERAVIERQVSHLVRLVDDLLDVSRIATGKVELRCEIVEVAKVIAAAIEMVSPLLEQKSHQLAVDVEQGILVNADLTRLAQIVSNLLSNAAKYTGPGGHLQLTAKALNGQIAISIVDDGIGITEEMLPRIFELFVQEPQALDRSQGGLGLGLAIVKSLVALHDGTVVAKSEGPGRGSEFTIVLPQATRSRTSLCLEDERPTPINTELRRILIVDDNYDAADLLSDILNLLGHETRVANDGPSALASIETFVPDVALIDIGLPVMDGYELARKLRLDSRLENAVLVAVTGYGTDNDRKLSLEAGFDLHLVKPVEHRVLVAAIARVRVAPNSAT